MCCSNNKRIVVTIDGPAGAGKSTVAKALARKMAFLYLDTGAMYRALTLKALQCHVNLEYEKDLVTLAEKTEIDLYDTDKGVQVLLDGKDVSEDIRSRDVTNNTFYIARVSGVRDIMVRRQRVLGSQKSVVIEGRDAGTVIFPDAEYKFYLDADIAERTRRRGEELRKKGKSVDDACIQKDIEQRDCCDKTRSTGPLKKADDAVVIDSTLLTIDDVVEKICCYICAQTQ